MQGFDFNYHDSFKNAVEAYATAECTLASSAIQGLESVREVKLTVEADVDKKHLFEDNPSTLNLPFTNFHFLPYSEEEVMVLIEKLIEIIEVLFA